MVTVRKAEDRFHTDAGWLNSRHTFAFGEHFDPAHVGFRSLRVINDDRVAAGGGFPTHGHRDMEILSYVLEGALEHRDNIGNGSVIKPGDVQRMSAGTGVAHSEQNASRSQPVHFLQIWILPSTRGLPPSYEQKAFASADLSGHLHLVASSDGREGSVTVHQDVDLWTTRLKAGEQVSLTVRPGRHAWVQVARGRAALNGINLVEGDGAALTQEPVVSIDAQADGAEILVFDLA